MPSLKTTNNASNEINSSLDDDSNVVASASTNRCMSPSTSSAVLCDEMTHRSRILNLLQILAAILVET